MQNHKLQKEKQKSRYMQQTVHLKPRGFQEANANQFYIFRPLPPSLLPLNALLIPVKAKQALWVKKYIFL